VGEDRPAPPAGATEHRKGSAEHAVAQHVREDDAVLGNWPKGLSAELSIEGNIRSMSDRTLTCRDCGTTFVFTANEQAFYAERGFSEPQRCPACRAARKAQRSGDDGYGGGGNRGFSSGPRQMFATVCSNCGKSTEVPFQPRGDKPVYCRECFQDRQPARRY
jgi:CxxC-x17-CxxC domain-containing protein